MNFCCVRTELHSFGRSANRPDMDVCARGKDPRCGGRMANVVFMQGTTPTQGTRSQGFWKEMPKVNRGTREGAYVTKHKRTWKMNLGKNNVTEPSMDTLWRDGCRGPNEPFRRAQVPLETVFPVSVPKNGHFRPGPGTWDPSRSTPHPQNPSRPSQRG